MSDEPDVDKLISQLGLGWTKFATRATAFLKVVITHASSGDEKKTLESLTGFYEAMDFGRIPGDPSHLFMSACEVLVAKRLLPGDLLPVGAFRGSEDEGARYLVLTSVGLAAQEEVHLYAADTRFSVEQLGNSSAAAETAPTGLLAAAARKMGTTTSSRLLVSGPGWELTTVLEGSRTDYARRICAKLASTVEQTWGKV
jgi:hypothetical protein